MLVRGTDPALAKAPQPACNATMTGPARRRLSERLWRRVSRRRNGWEVLSPGQN